MGTKKSPRIRERDGPSRQVQRLRNISNISPNPSPIYNITTRGFMSVDSDVKIHPVRLTMNSTLPSPLLPSKAEESKTGSLARVDLENKSSHIFQDMNLVTAEDNTGIDDQWSPDANELSKCRKGKMEGSQT